MKSCVARAVVTEWTEERRPWWEKLKKEYQYTADKTEWMNYRQKGRQIRDCFTLDGREYTGKMFAAFAASHPQGVQRQLKGFIMKSVLDYEYSRLEDKISSNSVCSCKSIGMECCCLKSVTGRFGNVYPQMKSDCAYFEKHHSDYH